MNPFQYIPIKISIFSLVYLISLIIIAPAIDHLFSDLKTDLGEHKTNTQILLEIMMHIVFLSVVWYFIHKYMKQNLESFLHVRVKEYTKTTIDIVSAIALIGLQKNLLEKLEYITIKHPFRVLGT